MDDAVPQSLFVVVSWDSTAPCCISLLQLETKIHNQDEYEAAADLRVKQRPRMRRSWLSFSSLDTELDQKEYAAHFNQPLAHGYSTPTWMFSPLKGSISTSTDEFYMLPFREPRYHETDVPLRGCAFNIGTQTCRSIPSCGIQIGHVVTLGGYIYVISQPISSDSSQCFGLPFLRYGPDIGFWERLNPFPSHAVHRLGTHAARVVATAVWDNTILFNMGCREIWAYEVERNKWYPVKVEDKSWCCSFMGEAVVLEKTIYALTTQSFHFIVALSIQREDIDDDIQFACSVRCKIPVPCIIPIQYQGAEQRTRYLVHLGEDNFCLVQSCKIDEEYSCYNYHQPIQLTNIKLNHENDECSITVIDECVHLLQRPVGELFRVESCFYLPECKTTPFKRGKNFCFNLDIFPAGFDPKEKLKAYSDSCYREPDEEFEDGPLVNLLSTSEPLAKSNATSNARAAHQMTYIDAKGYCRLVRNLLPDDPFGHFEEEMKKFGPSIGVEIQFEIVDDEVSALITEGHLAEMEEKRRIDLIVCRKVEEMSTIINEGCRAEMEEERRIPYALDTASAIITEGCRAEVEEERKIPYTVDEVSRITTEICQKEIEEEINTPYALDTVSTIITADCRAEMEEDRRIPYALDTVSDIITERERERRIRLDVEQRVPYINRVSPEDTDAIDMVSAMIYKVCLKEMAVCVKEMEPERRILLSRMVRIIMTEICRAETEEEKVRLTVDAVRAILDGDFDALMDENIRIFYSLDDTKTRRKQKKKFRDNLKKKLRDIALRRREEIPPLF